jgi:hypothetical protein
MCPAVISGRDLFLKVAGKLHPDSGGLLAGFPTRVDVDENSSRNYGPENVSITRLAFGP